MQGGGWVCAITMVLNLGEAHFGFTLLYLLTLLYLANNGFTVGALAHKTLLQASPVLRIIYLGCPSD